MDEAFERRQRWLTAWEVFHIITSVATIILFVAGVLGLIWMFVSAWSLISARLFAMERSLGRVLHRRCEREVSMARLADVICKTERLTASIERELDQYRADDVL